MPENKNQQPVLTENEDFSTNPARYKSLYGAIRNKEQKDV